MVTRAYITETDLENSRVRVRMPIFDGIPNSTDSILGDYDLCWATILYTPGIEVNYQVGDVVVVAFEDNNAGLPIVIGFLKLRGENKNIPSRVYATFKELTVEDTMVAPTKTTIGVTDYSKIFNATDVSSNTTTSSTPSQGDHQGEQP